MKPKKTFSQKVQGIKITILFRIIINLGLKQNFMSLFKKKKKQN